VDLRLVKHSLNLAAFDCFRLFWNMFIFCGSEIFNIFTRFCVYSFVFADFKQLLSALLEYFFMLSIVICAICNVGCFYMISLVCRISAELAM